MASTASALEAVDIPEPTDNGRLDQDAIARIQAAGRTKPARLYAGVLCWMAYLIGVAVLWADHGPVALALVPTVGVYLMSHLGYYRHELWHGYLPGISNPDWFAFVSYLMFSDPQVYRAAHPTHHKYVHTTDDIEFFCEGWQTRIWRRRLQFVAELLLGNIAWEITCLQRLKRMGRATGRAGRIAAVKRLALLLVLAWVATWVRPGCLGLFLGTYGLTIWAGSIVTRHNQWVEHLGIVSDGSLAERNMLTRNLRSDTPGGFLFNLLNHDDAREHVFHHTEPRLDSRGIPGLRLPSQARTVTMSEYLGILLGHMGTL